MEEFVRVMFWVWLATSGICVLKIATRNDASKLFFDILDLIFTVYMTYWAAKLLGYV